MLTQGEFENLPWAQPRVGLVIGVLAEDKFDKFQLPQGQTASFDVGKLVRVGSTPFSPSDFALLSCSSFLNASMISFVFAPCELTMLRFMLFAKKSPDTRRVFQKSA